MTRSFGDIELMRNRILPSRALLTILALGVGACSENLTDLNVNPNAPTNAPTGALFTFATRSSVDRWYGSAYDVRGTALVAQHLAEVQYPQDDQYIRLTASSTTTTFDLAYSRELKDFQSVVQRGLAENNARIYGPALVMRTWGFGYLTDSWGDIPYSEALRGDPAGGDMLTPVYDAQSAIYTDFFASLAKASADMSAPAVGLAGLGATDPIYAGSLTSWERFSNSLRMRFAMRIVNVDAARARTQFEAALAAPGGPITTNAQAPVFRYPGDGTYNHPWSVDFRDRDDFRLSNRLLGIMTANGSSTIAIDPRVPVYAQRSDADGSYTGAPNALADQDAAEYVELGSRVGVVLQPAANAYGAPAGTGASAPVYLITAAEVAFLRAEAAERGWAAGGTAASFYNQGIALSMAQWGVTNATAISAYLARADVAYQGGTAGLKQIAIQKWIALFTDGGQAWAENRRTCQPAIVKPGPAAISAVIPRRFQYSVTDLSANKSNVLGAVARQGPDDFSGRMYWDKAPTAAPTYEAGCGVR